MKPMLAKTKGPHFHHFPCYVQPKLNGIRALYQRGTFQSRDEKLWKEPVLKHLVEQLREYSEVIGDRILDGELYVHGWRLQRINSAIAVNRLEPTPDTPHVQFHVFDIVHNRRIFTDRWLEFSHDLRSQNFSHIHVVPTDYIANTHQLDQFFRLYTSHGYEGIMLRPDGVYEFGEHLGKNGTMTQFRSQYLWKHKQWQDGEYRCIGVTPGEGKAAIGVGALVLSATNEGDIAMTMCNGSLSAALSLEEQNTFKVGSGLDDLDRIEFQRNPPIGRLVKIRYLELTKDGIPFNPSFLCLL